MSKIKRVILIDDDSITNFIHEEIFVQIKFQGEVRTYEDPEKALKYLLEECKEDECPDLILLDINMPAMDGYDFLNVYLQADPKRIANVKIAAVTSSEYVRDIDKLATYDINEIIYKPLTVKKLNNLFRKLNLE